MPLNLIPMCINASKKVSPAMNIQHHPISFDIIFPKSRMVIALHLNPLALQSIRRSSPLPPLLASYSEYSLWTQFANQRLSRLFQIGLRNLLFLGLHPVRSRDFLGGECLQVFDGVVGDMLEKSSDNFESLFIRNMRGRFTST